MGKASIIERPVEGRILFVRGHKVLLDSDLVELCGVSVSHLNQQVKRNIERFPEDFMFRLTAQEHTALRLQFATSNKGRGGRRFLPYAFTEHGAIMAASVLNARRSLG
ncbi:MAG TPA: ORF6N domain-containing protein [Candidatus Angelobacter sp.]